MSLSAADLVNPVDDDVGRRIEDALQPPDNGHRDNKKPFADMSSFTNSLWGHVLFSVRAESSGSEQAPVTAPYRGTQAALDNVTAKAHSRRTMTMTLGAED